MCHSVCPLIFDAARSTGPSSAPCNRGRHMVSLVSKAKRSSPDIAKAFKGLFPRRLLSHFHAISIPRKTGKCVRDFGHHVFPNKRMANLCIETVLRRRIELCMQMCRKKIKKADIEEPNAVLYLCARYSYYDVLMRICLIW
jgi:hypothetical protein